MPNYTTNLNLEKPLKSEQYNIDVFNANADKIDQFAGQIPARALTADKLTTGAKINGVNFKGDTDIVTGAGFYYNTVTYGDGDLAFIYNQNGALELHKSLSAGNIGHNPLTSTGYWEKVELGGSGGRNVGEIIQSSLPLTDAGLHLLDGARLSGDGIYKGFVDYIANLYNDTKVYNPSAFTAVGSPTITDDGIASGFSSDNYINTDYKINTSNFEIRCKVKFNTQSVANSVVGDGSNNTFLLVRRDNGILGFSYLADSDGGWKQISTSIAIDNDKWNYCIVGAKNGKIYFYHSYISFEDVTLIGEQTNTIRGTYNKTVWISTNYDHSRYIEGQIDLKQFSITVDGKEVFNGSKSANYFCTETEWQASVSQYGVCGKFVYDSTNNTVRLPKITGIIEGTTDVTALGDLVEAGLPNITGSVFVDRSYIGDLSGAFLSGTYTASAPGSSNNNGNGRLNFDASRSSSIYGKSNTVQPQTIKCFVYIVIANSSKTDIQVDIDEIATDLNGKADIDLTNITNQAKILMGSMAMPDYSAGKNVSSATIHTATVDGYVFAQATSRWDGNGGYVDIYDKNGTLIKSWHYVGAELTQTASYSAFMCPIPKGYSYNVYGGVDIVIQFYPAKGTEV